MEDDDARWRSLEEQKPFKVKFTEAASAAATAAAAPVRLVQ